MNIWFYSLNSSIIRMLAGVGVLAIYARHLSIDEYSIVAIALLVGQIVTIVLDAGINSEILTTRLSDLASTMNKKLAEAATIKIVLCIPILIAYLLLTNTVQQTSQALFFFTALSVPIVASIENYATALKVQGRYKHEFVISLSQAVLVVSFAFMLAWDPKAAIVSIFAPRIIVLITVSVVFFRTTFSSFYSAIDRKVLARYFIQGRHFSLDSIATNLLNQIDGIAISLFLGKDEYGAYQPGSRLMIAGIGLGSAVAGVVIPRARSLADARSRKKYLFLSFALSGGLLSIGFLFFLLMFLGPIFGAPFKLDSQEAALLTLILFLRYLCAGVGAHLSMSGQQRARAIINAISIAICSIVLVPFHSSVKEILTSIVISQIFVLISYEIVARNYAKKITS